MTAKSPEPHAFGPVTWDEIENPYIYDSGTVLKPYNDVLNLKNGLLRMSVARVLPGQDVDHHDHYTMAEVYFLMRGQGAFRVNDQLIEVEQNTAMYFEPGVMRSVVNNSDEEAWWLFVGSPPDVKPE